ncbi:MAG: hypothetical protein WC256_02860 [Desulfurivibrionaceae bacterium]
MKRFVFAAAVIAATVTTPVLAADVGVSLSIGQPGFYGQIDIGDYPQPQVIYRRPIIVERGGRMDGQPIYLRVPPGHAKNWRKHCREYNACGERVLFVQDNWYHREYIPRYQERHRDRQHDRRDGGRNYNRGNDNKNRHGNDHGHGRNR